MKTRDHHALLSSLTADELDEISPLFTVQHFAAGSYLFHAGDHASGAFLIDEGEIDLELVVPGVGARAVYSIGAGNILGEPALVADAARQLGARARGDVATRFIEQIDFQALRNGFRPVSFKLMLAIARLAGVRIHRADEADVALAGDASAPSREPAPPLGVDERPGASFDPRPFLPRLAFFKSFPPSDIAELLAMGQLWELPRGRALAAYGQRSDRVWAVVRGAVEAVHPRSGRRVALYAPGQLCGELPPLLGEPSFFSLRTRERTVLLELGPEAFAVLTSPERRVAHRFINALTLDLLDRLERANRVLARTAMGAR
jgi:CRP-like cAMP-binding protein